MAQAVSLSLVEIRGVCPRDGADCPPGLCEATARALAPMVKADPVNWCREIRCDEKVELPHIITKPSTERGTEKTSNASVDCAARHEELQKSQCAVPGVTWWY